MLPMAFRSGIFSSYLLAARSRPWFELLVRAPNPCPWSKLLVRALGPSFWFAPLVPAAGSSCETNPYFKAAWFMFKTKLLGAKRALIA